MSRTRFWTILIGTDPTSFRSIDREVLVPTLKQLQRKHPEAVLRWYERGQVFESEEAARAAHAKEERERRPKEWRPGGEHRDPRDRYKKTRDEKRRLFKLRQRRPWGDTGEGAGERPRDQRDRRPPLAPETEPRATRARAPGSAQQRRAGPPAEQQSKRPPGRPPAGKSWTQAGSRAPSDRRRERDGRTPDAGAAGRGPGHRPAGSGKGGPPRGKGGPKGRG